MDFHYIQVDMNKPDAPLTFLDTMHFARMEICYTLVLVNEDIITYIHLNVGKLVIN